MFCTVFMKPEDVNLRPRSPFTWDAAMMTEVAEVKPTVTGIDMKSMSTPKLIFYK